MNKLFAILPATILSACVSMGAWAQAPAATTTATPAATPVTLAVAASAPGVKPVEVKPAAVASPVGPASTQPVADKASPTSTSTTDATASAKAKAGHKVVHANARPSGHTATVHPKAAKASVSGSAAIK